MELLNQEQVTTKIIYKELIAELIETVKDDYNDDDIYRTHQPDVGHKLVKGYRPMKDISRCLISITDPAQYCSNDEITEDSWWVMHPQKRKNYVNLMQKGDQMAGYRCRIVAGHPMSNTLSADTIDAIVKEDEHGSFSTPIIVGFRITIWGNGKPNAEEVVLNDDGSVHAFTKIQYQNLKNS